MNKKPIEQPKYNNEQILIHCMKREPHTLIFDHDFLNYREFEILQLCEDLEANYNYLIKIAENHEDIKTMVTIAQSLVWGALFHVYNDIIPEKYKTKEDE
jgi:hypothetical protein